MSETPLRDSLTGAYIRSDFDKQLIQNVELARKENTACSLLVFDLDHFKSINDAFGHTRGDEALREVANRVHKITRVSDLFFRYGGDEFTLILPNTNKIAAVEFAQRLLESVRSRPIDAQSSLTVTISIGVATFPEDAEDNEILFEKADARNYEAKRRGRAQVIAEEPEEVPQLPFAELSRLIERDDALGIAKKFLSALLEKKHGVLSIVGSVGTGRSRFLSEVEKIAQMQNFEIVSIQGTQRLKAKPYGALEHSLQGISFTKSTNSTFEQLMQALEHRLITSKRPALLICVDEFPLLDWGTVDLLRQLLSLPTLPGLGLVYSSDHESSRITLPFGVDITEQATLHPFSSGGMRIWLRALMQWEVPEEFIQWIEQQTHNIPQQVELLLTYMLKHGALIRKDSTWMLHEEYREISYQGLRQWQKPTSPNNLPSALTSFIGREKEQADIRRLLGTTRLLTVVGAGGLGKTRLTLQIAKGILNSFKEGIWFVELAPITDSELALYAIASVLGVHEEQSSPLIQTLSSWLSDKELLLILDNCEHLVDVCAEFAHKVLQASPNVRILASSREALDVTGELVYRMPTLDTPQAQTDLDTEDLTQYTSIQLFLDRATLADSTFSMTKENASAIAQICSHLDGIPLAIELAAARLKSLSLEEISARLSDRFSLLTAGNRGALPRQRTLRALVDWSYDLLSQEEKKLLQQVSTFSGGWTVEAAEQVCFKKRGEFFDSSKALDVLQRLADKSLISFDKHRFQMLETIRQYAREKLSESQEEQETLAQHLNYYLLFSEQAEVSLRKTSRTNTVKQLEVEHDNIRTALEYACRENILYAYRLAGSLGWFWYFGDHLNEGRTWCLRVLELNQESISNKEVAKLLGTAGMVSSNLGYNEEARTWLEKAIEEWKILKEQQSQVEALFWLIYTLVQLGQDEFVCKIFEKNEKMIRSHAYPLILGWSLSYWGRAYENAYQNYEVAKRFHDEGLLIGESTQDINILGTSYMNLGYWASKQGDYSGGYEYHLQALQWNKKDGARLRIAISLHNMGDMLSLQNKYEQALPLYSESLHLSRTLGDQAFIAWTAYRLGYLSVHLKDYQNAIGYFSESIKIYSKQSEGDLITSCIAGCAELNRAQGNFTTAVQLLGFAAKHPQSAHRIFLLTIDSIEYNHTIEKVRNELSVTVFESAWAKGQDLSLTEAIALATK